MSALSFISLYGSSTDESDAESEKSEPIKVKLQLPDLSRIPGVASSEAHVDHPSLHGGRVRAFPHVRGNWASFIYLLYPKDEALNALTERLLAALQCSKVSLHPCDDLHISLSKTIVLQYHLITAFTKSLQEIFGNIECFELDFSSLKVYCNEDKTRTFISLEVDHFTKRELLKIVEKVDSVLKDFRLPLFYEDPSFHMSILWAAGNKKAELTRYLDELNNILNEESGNQIKPVLVSDLNCKIGNKYFQFPLQ